MNTQRHGTEQDWTLLYYNELGTSERTALQGHLQACDSCRADYDRLCQTLNALPHLQPTLEPAARERFVARVTQRRKPLWHHPAFGGLLTTALAGVIAIVLWPAATLPPAGSEPQMATARVADQADQAAPAMRLAASKAAPSLAAADIEVVEDMDLLQNLDVLSQWDLVQDMES